MKNYNYMDSKWKLRLHRAVSESIAVKVGLLEVYIRGLGRRL